MSTSAETPTRPTDTTNIPWPSKVKRYLKNLSTRRRRQRNNSSSREPSGVPSSLKDLPPKFGESIALDYMDFSGNPASRCQESGRTSVLSSTLTERPGVSLCPSGCSSHETPLDNPLPQITPESAPQPFQCTFCLTQCGRKWDWIQHEQCTHMWRQQLRCEPNDSAREQNSRAILTYRGTVDRAHHFPQHNSDTRLTRRIEDCTTTSQSDPEHHLRTGRNQDQGIINNRQSWRWLKNKNNWFWNCGFCDTLLRSWTERQEHIAEHFEKGTTMSSWSPLRSPYPLTKFTLTPVPGFPRWDLAPLLAIQRPELLDFINR